MSRRLRPALQWLGSWLLMLASCSPQGQAKGSKASDAGTVAPGDAHDLALCHEGERARAADAGDPLTVLDPLVSSFGALMFDEVVNTGLAPGAWLEMWLRQSTAPSCELRIYAREVDLHGVFVLEQLTLNAGGCKEGAYPSVSYDNRNADGGVGDLAGSGLSFKGASCGDAPKVCWGGTFEVRLVGFFSRHPPPEGPMFDGTPLRIRGGLCYPHSAPLGCTAERPCP